jgi:taurine dioxygenase
MPQLSVIQPTSSSDQYHNQSYQEFTVQPVNGALGAELTGIDLSKLYDDSVYIEIHDALMRHQVIVFRDQDLSPLQLIELGRRFGDLHVNPFVKGIDDHPEVMPIRSTENPEKQFTGLWHSDLSWESNPSMGSILYATEVPKFGGDTLFANMYVALSSLSPAMQQMLEGLSAEHYVDRHHQSKAEYAETPEGGVVHPVVTVHPVTGKKILFVNEYFTTCFDGMSEVESEPLLNYLFHHLARPDFTCRIHWEPGTLVFWDNRCTQHYATNDYPKQNRLMHRVTINGEAPASAIA